MSLLDIKELSVQFGSQSRPFTAVDQMTLTVDKGEVVGIVGESGSGKSVTSLAIMGLIDFPGRVTATHLNFDGVNLQTLPEQARRKLLGKDIAMVFQDPMTSLDPSFTVGYQLMETLKTHEGGSRHQRRTRAIQLLNQVGIPDPENRLNIYPHQLSGGMSQRVVIAMSIACNPRLLIADEPTTALDVTIQAQIMRLLSNVQKNSDMAMILITHDLGLVAENCQRVVVMYAGQIVESGKVNEVFSSPKHPYTEALLRALPERAEGEKRLHAIGGVVPGAFDRPKGCLLNPRCSYCQAICSEQPPVIQNIAGHQVRCHFPLQQGLQK